MNFVLGIDFGLALIATLLLLRKRPPGPGDRFLIATSAATAAICAGAALLANGVWLPAAVTVFVGGSGFLSLPPLIYLYVRRETGHLRPYDWAWLLPAVAHAAWLLDLGARHGGLPTNDGFIALPAPAALPNTVPVLIGVAAPAAALIHLRRHRSMLRAYWTDTHAIDLEWAARLQIGTLVGSAIAALALIVLEPAPRAALTVVMLILGAQLLTFCAYAPVQRAIPLERAEPLAPTETVDLIPLEVMTAALVRSDRFRTEGYSLAAAAEDLGGVDAKRISASLAAAGTGFYDFVNGLRLQRACALLADPARAQCSVLDLAFEAGFQSKATFHRVFKARTGETPSAFRRRNLRSMSEPALVDRRPGKEERSP